MVFFFRLLPRPIRRADFFGDPVAAADGGFSTDFAGAIEGEVIFEGGADACDFDGDGFDIESGAVCIATETCIPCTPTQAAQHKRNCRLS